MIEILLFNIHIICALYIYTKRWQESGIKEGVIAIATFGLVFTIGWSLTSPIANFVLPNTWRTIWFTSDTLGLILLSMIEAVFFKVFFIDSSETKYP